MRYHLFLLVVTLLVLPMGILAQETESTPTETGGEKVPYPLSEEEKFQKEIDRYINQLMDDNPIVVDRARNELLEISLPAVPLLIKTLHNERPELRYMACEILAEIRDKRALPELLKLLDDKEEVGISIASMAVRALGRLGDTSVIPLLIKALGSTDVELRYEATRALGTLRARESIPEISSLITDTARTYYDYEIRCAVIEALGRLKARKSTKELINLLDNKDIEPATEKPVSNYVIEALERITGISLGIIPFEDDKNKEELIKKWQEWWGKNKGKYGEPEEPPEPKKPHGPEKPVPPEPKDTPNAPGEKKPGE